MRPIFSLLMTLLMVPPVFFSRPVLGAEGASADPASAAAESSVAAPAAGNNPPASASGGAEQPPATDGGGPGVGDDAPAFSLRAYNEEASLKLVKSPFVSLNNFVGLGAEYPRKVVVLGFFALWNEKSRQDLAVFQKLSKKFKDGNVAVVMISVDNKDTQSLYEVIEKEKITFPVLRDRFGVVYRRYDVKNLPTLYLIDKAGKIVSIGESYKGNVENYLEDEIKRLIAEP